MRARRPRRCCARSASGAAQVKVTDVTERCCMFSLLGPRAAGLLARLGAADLPAAAPHAHAVFGCAGARPAGPSAVASAPLG